jgi:hypothetical protein
MEEIGSFCPHQLKEVLTNPTIVIPPDAFIGSGLKIEE